MTGRLSPRWLAVYALPPAVWAGLIFWLSSRTASEVGDAVGPLAKVPLLSEAVHFGEYFILSWLLLRLLRAVSGAVSGRDVPAATPPAARVRDLATANLAGLIAFGYALSDEFHQTFVPGRTFAVVDLAVDLAGIVAGVAGAWIWRSR